MLIRNTKSKICSINICNILYTFQIGVITQEIIELPVTFYLENIAQASTDYTQADLYHASLCASGINGRKQAVLQIYDSANPEWNTSYGNPFVVVQVSKCDNKFDQDCVIATNYEFTGVYPLR